MLGGLTECGGQWLWAVAPDGFRSSAKRSYHGSQVPAVLFGWFLQLRIPLSKDDPCGQWAVWLLVRLVGLAQLCEWLCRRSFRADIGVVWLLAAGETGLDAAVGSIASLAIRLGCHHHRRPHLETLIPGLPTQERSDPSGRPPNRRLGTG